MIVLPPLDDDVGAETIILLAECMGPGSSRYTIESATLSMQMMDLVLWNRLQKPKLFMAKGAESIAEILKARGQFAGFSNYPNYDRSIANRINGMVNIANNSNDKRSQKFEAHINKAIDIANSLSIVEPSPGILVAWRTAGTDSPGSNFKFFKTIMGNDFYYIEKL